MIHITVQYDPGDRDFKLVDELSGTLLEGDALCDSGFPMLFGETAGLDGESSILNRDSRSHTLSPIEN